MTFLFFVFFPARLPSLAFLTRPKPTPKLRFQVYPWCRFGIDLCNGPFGFGFVCELALSFCQATVVAPIQVEGGNFNVYDVRLKCEGPLCYDFSKLDRYLAQPEVRKALNVAPEAQWEECNMKVNHDMLVDFMRSYSDRVTPLLDGSSGSLPSSSTSTTAVSGEISDKIRVLIYVGENDFIW